MFVWASQVSAEAQYYKFIRFILPLFITFNYLTVKCFNLKAITGACFFLNVSDLTELIGLFAAKEEVAMETLKPAS